MSSILPILLMCQSSNLINIILFQNETCWFIFIFPTGVIFFISLLAESNRTPFDLPEAESELIAGFHIEYSALIFALYFLSEYNHILVSSFLFSILFLGG
jgi:NADH-quinone oxidoreductase subunit H